MKANPHIVPRNSWLRHLPLGLQRDQAVRFRTIVFTCDLIEDAFERLCDLAEHYGDTAPGQETWVHAAMLSPCWTIVQQVNVLRRLLVSLISNGRMPEVDAFRARYEGLKDMRDDLEHLSEQVPNLVAKKDSSSPPFGALYYSVWKPESLKKLENGLNEMAGRRVCICGGPVLLKQEVDLFPDTASSPVQLPVSHYRFDAGDGSLKIEMLVNDLAATMQLIAVEAEKVVTKSIEDNAEERGLCASDALVPGHGNIHLVADFHSRFEGPVGYNRASPPPKSGGILEATGPKSLRTTSATNPLKAQPKR
jgi:hypothetical protein